MRIAAQNINNRGITVSRKRIEDTTAKYVKLYGQMCEKLYDLGYLPQAVTFDEQEFIRCFYEEYPDVFALLRNVTTGAISFSDKQLSYVLRVIGKDHDAYEVVDAARSVIRASQALLDLNTFMTLVKFPKRADKMVCKSRLTVSNRVYSSGKLSLDSPYLRECFDVPEGKRVVEYDYRPFIFRTLLKKLGVDADVDFLDDSVLLGDGFSVADDIEFLSLIIAGDIEGKGKYARQLHEAVESYYSDYYSTRTTIAECIKYEEQNFLDAIPSCIAAINNFRAYLGDYQEFFVTSEKVYFLVDGETPDISTRTRNIFIGEDIGTLGASGVSLMNRLQGYSGRFIYEFDDRIGEYEIAGLPVVLNAVVATSKGQEVMPFKYYPATSLKKKYRTMSIPVTGDANYVRKLYGVEEMKKFLDIQSIDGLDVEVAELVEEEYKVHPTEFKSLVGLLVQSLICVMCDYTLAGHKSPNHVILGHEYDWVTDEIYLDACAVAESFYGTLGF